MIKLNLPFHAYRHNKPPTKISTPNNRSWRLLKRDRSFPLTSMATTTKPMKKTSSLHQKWKGTKDQNDFSSLLEPMDPLLKSEVIRYGEMAQACYESFDNDPYSKYCGSCKVPPKNFFQDLGMNDFGYDITSYIYSSNTSNLVPKFFTKSIHSDGPWSPSVNWIGYVAVSDDETTARLGRRDIAIAWRGTVTKLEWYEDLMNFLKPVSAQKLASRDPKIKVMAGFLHIYTDKDQSCMYSEFSAREQLLAELARLTMIYGEKKEEISITITGHSLGSALAILSAYDIAESGLDILDNMHDIPISVMSFSGPRVGNTRFQNRLELLGVKVLRVFNVHDKVPNVPGFFLNEYTSSLARHIFDWTTWFYSHVGEELALDHTKSPFVKTKLDLPSKHNLELLLHLVDGYHGKGTEFCLSSGRDKALLNRDGDILKGEYLIPPKWFQVENKGLRKKPNGKWELPEQKGIEDHLRPEDVELHLRKLGLKV
ncbi:phospholipase A1-Igamma2, chloroplastic [Lactuca sativa]|uniref:Fungal lipase-type domain-containing protein n=1 Tax=Lactuca sativa TaxID=4236 RepID=A0A9R1VGJ7_LACSA|nr:phospholipase A1-Igamma2, chloroplastic [Lactuca sativa]KAJ0204341.1 hypothetical protein LSAT_V11C500253040 [Lactuca sativa]